MWNVETRQEVSRHLEGAGYSTIDISHGLLTLCNNWGEDEDARVSVFDVAEFTDPTISDQALWSQLHIQGFTFRVNAAINQTALVTSRDHSIWVQDYWMVGGAEGGEEAHNLEAEGSMEVQEDIEEEVAAVISEDEGDVVRQEVAVEVEDEDN